MMWRTDCRTQRVLETGHQSQGESWGEIKVEKEGASTIAKNWSILEFGGGVKEKNCG